MHKFCNTIFAILKVEHIFGHQTWDLEGGANWPPPPSVSWFSSTPAGIGLILKIYPLVLCAFKYNFSLKLFILLFTILNCIRLETIIFLRLFAILPYLSTLFQRPPPYVFGFKWSFYTYCLIFQAFFVNALLYLRQTISIFPIIGFQHFKAF